MPILMFMYHISTYKIMYHIVYKKCCIVLVYEERQTCLNKCFQCHAVCCLHVWLLEDALYMGTASLIVTFVLLSSVIVHMWLWRKERLFPTSEPVFLDILLLKAKPTDCTTATKLYMEINKSIVTPKNFPGFQSFLESHQNFAFVIWRIHWNSSLMGLKTSQL